jgi:hypothetical protein
MTPTEETVRKYLPPGLRLSRRRRLVRVIGQQHADYNLDVIMFPWGVWRGEERFITVETEILRKFRTLDDVYATYAKPSVNCATHIDADIRNLTRMRAARILNEDGRIPHDIPVIYDHWL